MENNSENFNKPEKKYLYHHVPEKIEGNKFTESHRIFIIDEENTWKRK
jgi:hypothetical protein